MLRKLFPAQTSNPKLFCHEAHGDRVEEHHIWEAYNCWFKTLGRSISAKSYYLLDYKSIYSYLNNNFIHYSRNGNECNG